MDAERKFAVPNATVADPEACQCGEVLRGAIKPYQCGAFGSLCTPETPLGALMVSSEGACAAYYQYGALKLSDAYADFDAELKYAVPGVRVADPKACQCGEVLKGVIKPWECKVFGSACTPEHAIGTCMVSPEGACAAYYNFGRFAREREVV